MLLFVFINQGQSTQLFDINIETLTSKCISIGRDINILQNISAIGRYHSSIHISREHFIAF